jgi:hypothetical protein
MDQRLDVTGGFPEQLHPRDVHDRQSPRPFRFDVGILGPMNRRRRNVGNTKSR